MDDGPTSQQTEEGSGRPNVSYANNVIVVNTVETRKFGRTLQVSFIDIVLARQSAA